MLKNKKILLSILLLLLLLILPNVVNAAVTQAEERTKTSTGVDVTWSYELSGGNIINLKCTNVASVTGSLTIPSTIDDYKVTSIGDDAFVYCAGLTSVTIPKGVTKIGASAFRTCTGLKTVTIPEGVTSIGNSAFMNCTGLPSITIPDTVTSIGSKGFSGCSGLTNVKLSANLTKLEDYLFSGCSGLKEIELPDNLTTIGSEKNYGWYSPFSGCSGLKFIKIPKNVVTIALNSAFSDCKNLTIYGEEESTAETFAKANNIKFEKIENWDKRNEKAPVIQSIKVGADDNDLVKTSSGEREYQLITGKEFSVIIKFDQNIVMSESPTLKIKFGTGKEISLTTEDVASDTLTYKYTIKSEDNGTLQIVSLSGGNVTNNNGTKAEYTLPGLSGYNLVAVKGTGSTGGNQSEEPSKESSKQETPSTQEKTDGNNGSSGNSGSSSEKDETISTVKLPYTGSVVVVWSIVVVAVIGTVAYIKYKKLKGVK